eukprot:UN05811
MAVLYEALYQNNISTLHFAHYYEKLNLLLNTLHKASCLRDKYISRHWYRQNYTPIEIHTNCLKLILNSKPLDLRLIPNINNIPFIPDYHYFNLHQQQIQYDNVPVNLQQYENHKNNNDNKINLFIHHNNILS